MRLRVRHPNGATILDSLTPDQTITDLKEKIAAEIDVPWQTIEVAGGYPPRTYINNSDTLQVAGIQNGDALNVKLIKAPIHPEPKATKNVESAPTASSESREAVPTDGGFLKLRTVPDDNSCLFRALGNSEQRTLLQKQILTYVLSRDTSMTQELRRVVAAKIREDPISYSDVTLGREREKYIEWIQKDSSWGGAIEISIFSQHFDVEIDSIDVQTGRIDRFGEGSYPERILIIYSGIHYDAVGLAPTSDAPAEFDQTRFDANDDSVLNAAKKLADILRQEHKFTDVANFTLKCNQCQKGLVGEKDAVEHAGATGHSHFVEY